MTSGVTSTGFRTSGSVGTKLKSTSWDGNNSSGFNALPAGARDPLQGQFGEYSGVGQGTWYWSSTQSTSSESWRRLLFSGQSGVHRATRVTHNEGSVRCLMN